MSTAGRWYMLSATGLVMLCTDEADAKREAANADRQYPLHAPHRAVQLAEVAPDINRHQLAFDASMRGRVGAQGTDGGPDTEGFGL